MLPQPSQLKTTNADEDDEAPLPELPDPDLLPNSENNSFELPSSWPTPAIQQQRAPTRPQQRNTPPPGAQLFQGMAALPQGQNGLGGGMPPNMGTLAPYSGMGGPAVAGGCNPAALLAMLMQSVMNSQQASTSMYPAPRSSLGASSCGTSSVSSNQGAQNQQQQLLYQCIANLISSLAQSRKPDNSNKCCAPEPCPVPFIIRKVKTKKRACQQSCCPQPCCPKPCCLKPCCPKPCCPKLCCPKPCCPPQSCCPPPCPCPQPAPSCPAPQPELCLMTPLRPSTCSSRSSRRASCLPQPQLASVNNCDKSCCPPPILLVQGTQPNCNCPDANPTYYAVNTAPQMCGARGGSLQMADCLAMMGQGSVASTYSRGSSTRGSGSVCKKKKKASSKKKSSTGSSSKNSAKSEEDSEINDAAD